MHHNPIFIEDLTYTYPDRTRALEGIALSIEAAQRVALVGANGSGKSTLLLHLNGILAPQSGKVIIGPYPVAPENLAAIRNFVGLVFQNPDDQLFMPTVREDVAFGPMNQGLRGEELHHRVLHSLHAVGLDPDRYGNRPSQNLSGGEKKRVAIAGVLAMQPQVLVFDEPTAQLDPRSRRQLIHLLRTLPQTQIIATHDLDMAWELCDRTVILNKGRIVRDDKTDKVLSDGEFLERHDLEPPLAYSRPYCHLADTPLDLPRTVKFLAEKGVRSQESGVRS
ncbi:energy-coupling factor ABC transporter ATP-binding protein [Pannus brasiliensis CCIBt3594]|uniref:ABC transporter ATP-binding protein n=1 Tax=Pannus brasiliensis CCIBt3594 TaxID=1427578 RepID=A0AAW9QQM7_9CHRO